MKSQHFNFYRTMFSLGYLDLSYVKSAAYWEVITEAEYKEITGEAYAA